ncbi:serine/threonine-protein kinase Kist [Pseudoscourfieldia marina]
MLQGRVSQKRHPHPNVRAHIPAIPRRDGVQRDVLSADERWQGVEPLRWVVYNDFRVASLTHILEALADEAHRVAMAASQDELKKLVGYNVEP